MAATADPLSVSASSTSSTSSIPDSDPTATSKKRARSHDDDRDSLNDSRQQSHDAPERNEPQSASTADPPASARNSGKRLRTDDLARGQRLFGVMLGTLSQFKKQTTVKSEGVIRREQKDQAIMERLQRQKQEEAEKIKQEQEEKARMREEQRVKAEKELAEATRDILKSYKAHITNYICTRNPTNTHQIYFLPAKHNQRTQELLAESKRQAALASIAATPSPTRSQNGDGAAGSVSTTHTNSPRQEMDVGPERRLDGSGSPSRDGEDKSMVGSDDGRREDSVNKSGTNEQREDGKENGGGEKQQDRPQEEESEDDEGDDERMKVDY